MNDIGIVIVEDFFYFKLEGLDRYGLFSLLSIETTVHRWL